MSAQQWFYVQDKQRKGPVDETELKRLLRTGALGQETLIWSAGMKEWLPAGRLDALQPGSADAAPAGETDASEKHLHLATPVTPDDWGPSKTARVVASLRRPRIEAPRPLAAKTVFVWIYNILRTVVVLGILGAIVYFWYISQQPVKLQTFTCEPGGFSISMPAIPALEIQTNKVFTFNIVSHTYFVEARGYGFFASYVDLPPEAAPGGKADNMLGGMREMLAEKSRCKLISDKRITLENYPGLAIEMDRLDGKGTVKVRTYLVGTRIYMYFIGIPRLEQDPAYIDRFMESFRLLKK